YHLGGATLSKVNSKKTYLNFRNSLFTLIKNAKGPLFPVIFVRLFLDGLASIKFLFELKPNHSLAILKSHVSFYWYLPYLLKQRNFQKIRIKYFDKTSVVIDYFINKKTTFNCL